MTVLAQNTPTAPLSTRLSEPLRMVAGRDRVLRVLRGILQLLVLTAATWLAVALVMGLWDRMPLFISIPLASLAWASVAWGFWKFLRPAFRHQNIAQAALLIDRALPDSQERISSAVEISQESDPQFRGSPELVAHLIKQAEHDAATLDPNLVVSPRQMFKWLGFLMPLALAWAIAFFVLTPNILAGLQRTLAPWTANSPLAAPILTIAPGNIELAQGDTVTITLSVASPDSATKKITRAQRATLLSTFPGGQSILHEMDRTGDLSFRAIVENVQQSFSYRITSDGNDSPLYTVTMLRRPAIASITLDYTYPAYTRMKPRTETNRDGTIDALAGTCVKITVQANEKLKSGRLELSDYTSDEEFYPLKPAGSDTQYAAEFPIRKSGQYRIQLAGTHDLTNRDDLLRNIHARIDAPPQIAIVSPTAPVKVRPDDTVSIKFNASDDFGLAKLEALVQVDQTQTQIIPLDLPADRPDPALYSGQWQLSVADILKPHFGREPRRISYQLRITDNRDPDPQTALSATQLLDINREAAPLAQRQDVTAARDLAKALRTTAENLEAAQQKIDDLKKADAARALTAQEKQAAGEVKKQLADSAQQLKDAAEKSQDSHLKDIADRAAQAADKQIVPAAEDMAQSQLADDKPRARQENFDKAQREIAEARKNLREISRQLNATAKDQNLAREIERLAEQQRQLAEQLAKNPRDPALQQQQRDLQKQLENLISQNPDLQKPAADAAQAQTQDLVKKIEDLKAQQKPVAEQLKQQVDGAQAKEKLSDLARKQQDLNKQVENFTKQNADALRNSSAKPPEPKQMDPIVEDLKSSKLQNAQQQQKAAAAALDNTADKLDAPQKKPNDAPPQSATPQPTPQPAARQAEQDDKTASSLKDQAQQLARQIDQAKKDLVPPTRPSDPANQTASQLADDLRKAARQMASNPANKPAADDAAKLADEAKHDAHEGMAESAQKKLSDAAGKLAEAARAAKKDAQAAAASSPKPAASEAAKQAHALSEQQKALADETDRAAKSLAAAEAAKQQSAPMAEQQKSLAEQIDQAAQQAQKLSEQTHATAPQTAEHAAKAAQSLQNAAQSQRAAASAQKGGNPQKASSNQQESAKSLAEAQNALSPESPSPEKSSSESANAQQNHSADSAKNSSPDQGKGQESATGSKPGSDANSATASKPGSGQSPSQTHSAQSANASKPGEGQSPSQTPSAQSASASKPGAGQSSPQSPSQTPSGQSPESSPDSAAQDVQSAHDQQSQAAQGNPSAAQQAAQSLQHAAQSVMQNAGHSSSSETAMSSPSPSSTPGQTPGQPGQPGPAGKPGSDHPQQASGAGTTLTTGAKPGELPKPVQDIGISPSDWARLPPNMQNELLNSAQQSGPPSYHEMIKNYYTRIARLQAENGAGQ